MITLINGPERTNGNNGEISRWNSIRQPVLFSFWRKDIEYTSITNNGGFVRINSGGLTLYGYTPTTGEQITLVQNSTKNKKVGKVVSWSAGQPIETDIPWDIAFSSAGWANFSKREAYKIRIALLAFIPTLQQTISLGMAEGTPDSIGRCNIDVSGLLTYGCEKINNWDFATVTPANINAIDYSGWLSYTTEYDDVFYYNGVLSTTTKVTSTTQYFGVDGVKQLLTPYGQNFCDYLPTVIMRYPAKFLTKFPRLYYFKTYPFSVSFLIRSELKNSNWQFYYEDGTGLTSPTKLLGPKEAAVNLFTIPSSLVANKVNNQIIYIWLQAQSGSVTYENPPTGYDNDFPYNQPPTTIGTAPANIPKDAKTEIKEVVFKDECKQSPVYLMWKNSLGGWDYWLFSKSNEVNYSASTGDTFDVYIYDLEVQNASNKIIQASGRKAITVGDLIQQDMVEGFADLERSPAVFLLHDPRKLSGNRPQDAWMQVQIAPKGIKYKSQSSEVQIEITVVLPEYFTLPN